MLSADIIEESDPLIFDMILTKPLKFKDLTKLIEIAQRKRKSKIIGI